MGGDLGIVLQIFGAFKVWQNEPELIAFVFGVLPAHFARIIVAIHVDVAAFFATEFADLFVALLKIRTAAVSAPLGMADVGAVYRVGNECTDRKSTRLNSSHSQISYAVFCLKK